MNKIKIPNTMSYMMAVPKNKREIQTPDSVMYRLKRTKDINVTDVQLNKHTGHPTAIIEYKGKKYGIDFYADTFRIPKGYVFMHKLTEEDMNVFKEEIHGITTVMHYNNENPLECYHLQLKFMQCIIPNMAGAVDFNTERILSGVWLGMAAMSNTVPAPYHVCAVSAVSISPESKTAWMHTHGLNRCGFCEFEIINADKERAAEYGNILTSVINKVIYEKDFPAEKEPVKFTAFTDNESEFLLTWLDWKHAVNEYKEDVPGGKIDREGNHNMFISSLFAYMSDDDAEKNKITDLNDVSMEKIQNAVWTIPAMENVRTAELAKERLGFLRDGVVLHKNAKALVKICLAFENNGEKAMEYVWINLHRIDNQMIYGVVETQPVFTSSVKKNDPIKVEISALADWILYTETYTATPDTSYLIVEELVAYKAARQAQEAERKAQFNDNIITSADDITQIDDIISKMD